MVNVIRTWPEVVAGRRTPAEAVLRDWGQLPDDSLLDDIEIVLSVYQDEIVAVFDLDPTDAWKRVQDHRVRFFGEPSIRWAHLIGTTNPGWSFSRRGVARAVQPVPLSVFTAGTVAVNDIDDEAGEQEPRRRAIVGGFTLTVVGDHATLLVPAGRSLTIETR